MSQLKPYLIETKDFIFTYHGGGYNPEHIQNLKRSNISTFTKTSQKRLVMYLETVSNFNPTYLFFIQFPNNPDFKSAYAMIKSMTRSLSAEKFHPKKIPPLFIWKRLVINGCLNFEVLTNFSPDLSDTAISFYLNTISKYKNESIPCHILPITDDLKELVSIDFSILHSEDTDTPSTGRWWGVINRQYYHCKDIKKKNTSLLTILSKEAELGDNKLSNNFYKK